MGWGGRRGRRCLPDGRVCFVETFRSQVSVWSEGSGVTQYAYTAGGPNSCVVGRNGELYVCQNGGTVGPWRAAEMSVPSIQRIDEEGRPAEIIVTEIDGIALNGPNDLVFGPDGRLYLTDPGHLSTVGPRAVAHLRARRERTRSPSSSNSIRRRSRTGSPSRLTAASCGPSRTPEWSVAADQTGRASRTSACCRATTPSLTVSPSPPMAGCSSPPSTAEGSTCSTPTERTTSSSRPGRSRRTACSTGPAC